MSRSHLVCFYHSESDVSDLVTAALHPELGIKTVTIFSPRHQQEEANHVARALRSHRLNVNMLNLSSIWDGARLSDAIRGILSQQHPHIYLNLSHIPPAAAIAAFQLANEFSIQAFAIEPRTDILHWVHNPAQAKPLRGDVPDTLSLRQYLHSNGIDCVEVQQQNTPIDTRYFECAKRLGAALQKNPQLISLIAEATAGMQGTESPRRLPDIVRNTLAPLTCHGLFWISENGHLILKSPEISGFIRGVWLEYLVYQSVLALKETLNLGDVAMGVKIELHSGIKNELDVAFMRNNQLYVIECKSLSPKSQQNDLTWVFKIDSVSDILGPNTPAMLAFVGRPTANTLTQASERDIQVLFGAGLEQIEQKITQWIQQVES